jgi:molybdate transport system substrate-binding protein
MLPLTRTPSRDTAAIMPCLKSACRPLKQKTAFCLFLLACLTGSLLLRAAQGGEVGTLQIAAAADLVFCLDRLNAEFKKAHPGVDLKVSTGSSGNFFAQIQNGAPFDVFLSADMKYPRDLAKAGLADEKTLTQYAVGRIVLWTTWPDVDLSKGLESLRADKIRKFAIANPDHAPYGRAAKAALEHEKLWEAVQPKLVLGENIAQTAQFVQTGNAEAGIVALSLVLAPVNKGLGKYQEIPAAFYPPLEQGLIITKYGGANPLAAKYLEFLRSKEARAIFDEYGFRLPPVSTPEKG